jgi:hypothetical protein
MSSRPANARASSSALHAARQRAELAKYGVARLEDRPCPFCKGPIGSKLLNAAACDKRECQLARIRATRNRASVRYHQRNQARASSTYQPDPIRTITCTREGCGWRGRTRNRLLCPKCHRNEDRFTQHDDY